MLRAILLLAAAAPALWADGPRSDAPPFYSEAGIANAASHTAGPFAPYVIASIYGTGLARTTAAVRAGDHSLPVELAGVQVLIGVGQGGQLAGLFFVSPGQINFLIPASLSAGPKTLMVTREGVRGPAVALQLEPAAPAPFLQADSNELIATHLDYSLITPESPARAAEVVILWAGGLGPTKPPRDDFAFPQGPAGLAHMEDLHIRLGGQEVDRSRIYYAGIAPGLPGLYQINLWLPEELPPDPELRIDVGGAPGPAGLVLRVR